MGNENMNLFKGMLEQLNVDVYHGGGSRYV